MTPDTPIINPPIARPLKPPSTLRVRTAKAIDLLWKITDTFIAKYMYPSWISKKKAIKDSDDTDIPARLDESEMSE